MNQPAENKFARVISTLFVPPVLTLFTFTYFAFALEIDTDKRIVLILLALLLGFFSPLLLFILFRRRGKLSDSDALIKEERTIPFFISIIIYLIGFFILIQFEIHIISIAFWFCYISNTLLTIFINRFWKISVHTMGVAGPIAALTFLLGWYGLLFLILLTLVGWSRIELKCHSLTQVTGGALVAFFSTLIQMNLIIKYFN